MEEVKDGLALGSTSQVEFRGISSLGGDAASWQVKSPILAEKKTSDRPSLENGG